MTVALTGGGSGGHITPILAVANELKKLDPNVRTIFIGQKGDKLVDVPANHPAIDEVYMVRAGKFRRYHGEGLWQLLDLKTQFKNTRDALWVIIGLWQSYWLLRKLKPQVIFTRGGFVSVPVALGGKLNHIPYITHDSDSTPSLANRLIAHWASQHTVALPEDLYPYPRQKTTTVGIPISGEYVHITPELLYEYRRQLGLDRYTYVLLVTGGGNGAQLLNKVVIANAAELLRRYEKLAIIHIAGRAHEQAVEKTYNQLLSPDDRSRVIVKGFTTDLYLYSGAADVIIARGGATNLAELAIQGKACVIIPSKQLVWQVRHAKTFHDLHAIELLTEKQSEEEGRLASTVSALLDSNDKRLQLKKQLSQFARQDAARQLAALLLDKAKSP